MEKEMASLQIKHTQLAKDNQLATARANLFKAKNSKYRERIRELEAQLQSSQPPLQAFTCFDKLPAELRLKIIHIAISTPEIRSVELRYRSWGELGTRSQKCVVQPEILSIGKDSLLKVNSEFRTEAKKALSRQSLFRFHINRQTDITRLFRFSYSWGIYFDHKEVCFDDYMACIPRVAVPCCGLLGDNGYLDCSDRLNPRSAAAFGENLDGSLESLGLVAPRELIITVGNDELRENFELVKPRGPPSAWLNKERMQALLETYLSTSDRPLDMPDTWEVMEDGIVRKIKTLQRPGPHTRPSEPYLWDHLPLVKFMEVVAKA